MRRSWIGLALVAGLVAGCSGSTATGAPAAGAGEQLCQHHCPVAHVAAEFPELCEAETEAFSRLLGTPVQRLATIARGDGVCTTHVTDRSLAAGAARKGPQGHEPKYAADKESGGLLT